MGASGAGKTTLLNVLAGFTKSQDKVEGSITVNGLPVDSGKMRRISGFVHQEDVILHTMTVREALVFGAILKLPSTMPRPQKVQRALDIAALLNLQKSLDSMVGSSMLKGISGGEKRRLSLGIEMVTEPAILFLDEPSSGLDAFNAFKVVHILRSVAHRHGRTILCTIHQPSSEVFHMFDDLIILADGQVEGAGLGVIYLGEVEGMVDWFGGLGYRCPTYTNPADYLFMEVLNSQVRAEEVTQTSGDGTARVAPAGEASGRGTHGDAAEASPSGEDARITTLIKAWKTRDETAMQRSATSRELLETGISKEAENTAAAFWIQVPLLAQRAARNAWRNPLVAKGKLAQTIFLSVVVGLIFLRIGDDQRGVQDRQGSLFFLVVQGMFGSVMGVLTVFGAEKAVFQREYGNRMYGLPAYFISRWLVELPFHVVCPVLSAVICYWLIGYQNKAERFGWFALTMVLMDTCGAGLGIFVSCLFNDLSVALSVMPMFLLPLMVFSGFFVNSNTIPPYFSWIQYISPMHYGFIALAKNEFSGLQIKCKPDQGCAEGYNGDMVLRNMGFDDKGSVQQNAGILFAMMWGLLILAYVALFLAVRRLTK
ncbi:hypothetical protein GPECTOR_1g597 [Gonium pectorale]|uniref:ABC transporter domain-containing protein n=1 Tax=Gonium pectorale TaxID=33097 RepID=A0A150H3R0_GONPE|nr:hypothetical protein GPECTOR_1g597 [Gonium pectorale]|eukprot:KXZ56662.1 hypothetical protein GPECTOR_1g597 [Gonium pectorale]